MFFPWTVLTLGAAVHLLTVVDAKEVTVWSLLTVVIVLLMLSRCLKMEAIFWWHLHVVAMMSDIIIMVVDGVVAIEVISSHAAIAALVVQLAIVRQKRRT